jgi:hypothetical protein
MICLIAVTRARRWAALAAVLALSSLSACNGGDASLSDPPETVGTAPAQTTTTDPYAVPAVIDEAYVNRVLAGLDAVMGDVARLVVKTRTIPPEAVERLRSVYGVGNSLQLSLDLLQKDMQDGFSTYAAEPGNPRTTVTQLITAQRQCIFASALRDYSAVAAQPSGRQPSAIWIALRPLDPRFDPPRYNKTPWYLAYDGYAPGRVAPGNPCAGS